MDVFVCFQFDYPQAILVGGGEYVEHGAP